MLSLFPPKRFRSTTRLSRTSRAFVRSLSATLHQQLAPSWTHLASDARSRSTATSPTSLTRAAALIKTVSTRQRNRIRSVPFARMPFPSSTNCLVLPPARTTGLSRLVIFSSRATTLAQAAVSCMLLFLKTTFRPSALSRSCLPKALPR